jgi:membrane-associated phospholipid phosphatase
VAGRVTGEEASHRRHREAARTEMVVGGTLVAVVLVGGGILRAWPAPDVLDRLVWHVVPSGSTTPLYTGLTRLRAPVVVGAAVLLAAVTLPRNRWRALACLIGPLLALAVSELVVKPGVGRMLGGSLSYPSGSTVGAAAVATAACLAAPRRLRVVAVAVAVAYVGLMAVSVVATGSHFPTDALGGVAFGAGVMLLTDGGLARTGRWWGRHREAARR